MPGGTVVGYELLTPMALLKTMVRQGPPWILIVDGNKVVRYMPSGAPSMEQAVSEMKATLRGRGNTPNQ